MQNYIRISFIYEYASYSSEKLFRDCPLVYCFCFSIAFLCGSSQKSEKIHKRSLQASMEIKILRTLTTDFYKAITIMNPTRTHPILMVTFVPLTLSDIKKL